jgi:predicted ATPase
MIASLEKHRLLYNTEQMIKSLEIKSFRGYEQLYIDNLRRVNIIVGESGSGKTALLEAIYLALGADPELYFKLRKWRGLGESVAIGVGDLWNDIFYISDDKNSRATISYTGSSPHTRKLEIYFDFEAPTLIPFEQQVADVSRVPPIAFKWSSGEIERVVHGIVGKDGVEVVGLKEPQSGSFFTSQSVLNPIETSSRFSQLSINGKSKEVIKSMKMMFPVILNLSVENPFGSPLVWANLKGVAGKRQLGLVSSGINKILALILGVFVHADGVVLIDEIENGLYYKTMVNVWKELYRFSKQNNTQLFISTHSLEALKYLLPALKGNEKDFTLIKTRFENGVCKVKHTEGAFLESALEEDVEIRS